MSSWLIDPLEISDRSLRGVGNRQEFRHVERHLWHERLDDVALVGAGAVARAEVDLSARALEGRVDERDGGMEWIAVVGANHDTQLVAGRTNQRTEREERDDALDHPAHHAAAHRPFSPASRASTRHACSGSVGA